MSKELFKVRREGDEDWMCVRAESPEQAAVDLIAYQERSRVEYPVASGHETAVVEVKDVGRFEVEADTQPQYRADRITPGNKP